MEYSITCLISNAAVDSEKTNLKLLSPYDPVDACVTGTPPPP